MQGDDAAVGGSVANTQSLPTAGKTHNTRDTYWRKQQEFVEFCQQRGFIDHDIVTTEKLMLFLTQALTVRPFRVPRKKTAVLKDKNKDGGGEDSEDDGDGDGESDYESDSEGETRLSWRSVQTYVTAVTDLWRTQAAAGVNLHPYPRDANVKNYIRSLKQARRQHVQRADIDCTNLPEGFTEDQLEEVCRQLWSNTYISPECHFRTLVDILLGHYMLTRDADRRSAQISDLFSFEFRGEGSTRCMPVILTKRVAKRGGRPGRLEAAGALRNRRCMICLLSALGFYLLYRWDFTDETFPNLGHWPAWQDIYLIKGTKRANRTTALSRGTHQEWLEKAFGYIGITPLSKTRIGRDSDGKTAELKGINEDQIRGTGCLDQGQKIGCYLNALPLEFMRTVAGHPPQVGCFEVPRAHVAPPARLLSSIWPALDRWKNHFDAKNDNGEKGDLAAMGFIDLLLYLREVILQDSAILRTTFPANIIWNHPAFMGEDYTSFAKEVEAKEPPSQPKPAAPRKMSTGNPHAPKSRIYNMDAMLKDAMLMGYDVKWNDTEKQQTNPSASVFPEQAAPYDFVVPTPGVYPGSIPATAADGLVPEYAPYFASHDFVPHDFVPHDFVPHDFVPHDFVPHDFVPVSSIYSSSIPTSTTHAAANAASPTQVAPVVPAVPAVPAVPVMPAVYSPDDEPPVHRMCRTSSTVEALWNEWTIGLPGQPSIEFLDTIWGTRWRAGCRSEAEWYYLRLEVIREIRRVAMAQWCTEEAAMLVVQARHEQLGCSLNEFCAKLRTDREAAIEETPMGAYLGQY